MSQASLYPPTVFNVYKPKGPSSGEVLNHFKRHLPRGYGKIGHFGTLDPFAQGILLIGIAGAQRLNDFIHQQCPKTYVARGRVGLQTDTGDELGQVIKQSDQRFTLDQLKLLESSFKGSYWQVPPAFSALKHEGKPLYEYARQGVMIEKEPVERRIFDLKIQDLTQDIVTFEVSVSSGTYVRTLFEDLMCKMGTVGHLIDLTRTRIGPVSVESSLQTTQWPNRGTSENQDYPKQWGLSVQDLLPWPVIRCDEHNERMFRQGVSQRLEQLLDQPQDLGPHWFVGERLLGAAKVEDGSWRQLFQF